MRFHPTDPTNYLIEVADLDRDPPHELVRENLHPLRTTVEWAKTYLCRPHEQLGRKGYVCPYVPMSLEKGFFFMTVYRGERIDPEQVRELVMKYRDWFLELEPRESNDAQYKTILMLFPDIDPEDTPQIIDETQSMLKPDYVAKGIMIGEFHQGPPQKAGLWNPAFRPLASPIPMLVIRHMVPTDFPFLKNDRVFVDPYLSLYGQNIPKKLRAMVEEAVRRFGLNLPS
jgi:hypothetical protein